MATPRYDTLTVGPLDTNCYLLYDEEGQALIVDPGDEADRILAAIAQRGLQVAGVLLTHVHFDHMMAAGAVARATGAPVIVPAADAPALSDPRRSLIGMAQRRALSLHADRLVTEGDTVAAGAMTFTAMHTPGHTPGSTCYVTEGLLIAGDTLFEGSVGRTDFPGGNGVELRRSLARLAGLEGDYTVLPGHGPSTTLDNERAANPYLWEASRA